MVAGSVSLPAALATQRLSACPWPNSRLGGSVSACSNTMIECRGVEAFAGVGDLCWVTKRGNPSLTSDRSQTNVGEASKTVGEQAGILCEIVALKSDHAILLPYFETDGISLGSCVWLDDGLKAVRPSIEWRGRVVDALANPIDGKGALTAGDQSIPLMRRPIAAHERTAMGGRMTTGVTALDLFTPCCFGQRLGIFAGSGVGKSSLISMIAQHCEADLMVIGLIGERGRELHDFLSHTLGPEGLERSVVVAATSDMPAMMRRRAAYLSMAVAEYFRDQGYRVLCLLDSVTRFAMALREIYLAAGEPPTTKGYPPTVFAELPRLLERAGPGPKSDGSITGLFSVLVEGDDTNEPISDTVRGILDGHVIMDRQIAERGRFPAIDVLQSVSRTAPGCYTPAERPLIDQARRLMRLNVEMTDLIQLGAYQQGANAEVDQAVAFSRNMENLLHQPLDHGVDVDQAWRQLALHLQA